MNNLAIQKLAKILRCPLETLDELEEKAKGITGKKGVLEKIFEENQLIIKNRLERLGLSSDSSSEIIYKSLLRKIAQDDQILLQQLGNISLAHFEDLKKIVSFIKIQLPKLTGYFLKESKARELFLQEPPPNTLKALGYQNAEEMLEKEDLFEIFASLRFLENNEWLNQVFFKQYENLKPEDFEERQVEIRILDPKWVDLAKKFVEKKYHNLSHLKEFGMIFIIPTILNIPGEILRMISLLFHYYYEVKFYSDIFQSYSQDLDFALKIIKILKGEPIKEKLPATKKLRWLVIQQYLAKHDENDWRLFLPHINPEVLHWQKAEEELIKLGEKIDGLKEDFRFWENLDWVGDYFLNENQQETLISFNMIDLIMSLVKEKEMIKYLYHHQEALWNKIFEEYFGEENLEKLIKENLLRGYFEI